MMTASPAPTETDIGAVPAESPLTELSYRELLDGLFDGVYFVDCHRRITYWNRGAEHISGYEAAEVEGRLCFDNILGHVDDAGCALCSVGCPLSQCLRHKDRQEMEVYLRHKQGHRVPVSVRAAPILDGEGNVLGAVEVFSDISAKLEVERRAKTLEMLAFQDALTGIPNRRYAEMKLKHAIQEVEQFGVKVGVLMVDLDHFKEVNDTHGHAAGDAVLCSSCHTIKANMRSENMLARWGGEEFLLVVKEESESGLVHYAERLRHLVAASSVLEGEQRISVTASVGATMIRPGETMEVVVERADQLLYESKRCGRNRCTVG